MFIRRLAHRRSHGSQGHKSDRSSYKARQCFLRQVGTASSETQPKQHEFLAFIIKEVAPARIARHLSNEVTLDELQCLGELSLYLDYDYRSMVRCTGLPAGSRWRRSTIPGQVSEENSRQARDRQADGGTEVGADPEMNVGTGVSCAN